MSSLFSSTNKNTTTHEEGRHGPHNSRVANAADPRVDSDRDNRANPLNLSQGDDYSSSNHYTTGAFGASGAAPNTHGPHKSDMMNKMDPRVDSDLDGSRTIGGNKPDAHNSAGYSTREGATGPHQSRLANALDPRVDSDHDGSNTYGNTHNTHGTGFGNAQGTAGPHNSRVANTLDPRVDSNRDGSTTVGNNNHNTTRGTGFNGTSEGLSGPHQSRVANAMDPRVDSDRDGSNTFGNTHNTYGNTHGSGMTSEGISGPHNSRVANAMDPRVDSDRDGSRIATTGAHTHGTREGTHGPHESRIGNAMDPRVDSDRDGSNFTTGTSGTTTGHHATGHVAGAVGGVEAVGPARNTAGPHKSDILNKMDPRVDSDLDGSKTFFGNKTYAQS